MPPKLQLPVHFSSHALGMLQRVQQGLSRVELVYTSHDRWPCLPTQSPGSIPSLPGPLRISVLDASFNPPTLAHLALANAKPPHPSIPSVVHVHANNDYDARLLLLSVSNPDKTLKPGDATHFQRLEMMYFLSEAMSTTTLNGSGSAQIAPPNIAIAIVDEPLFIGKSTTLLTFLRNRLSTMYTNPAADTSSPCQLTFLLGMDTLVRLISLRYYPSEDAMNRTLRNFFSPDGEDCRVVCARRISQGIAAQAQEDIDKQTLAAVHEFVEASRISTIDLESDVQEFSSSEVRAKVKASDDTWAKLVAPAVADYIVERKLYQDISEKR
ncbi:hypothetical protein BJ138DRAFT_1081345 [Hygrophoropsis aurantiaca]|uniref:Uncharacterized protein n=1 Tax=Hygrophoropsis aurantiaca TaxID=72124 RepID=A0ACB8AKR7_9AGAM|nr:hypothetical protein BJ138DRAFT_1081345 [Hygrophoropsis aurantiaca]